MTLNDPYTGVRTRENIVAVGDDDDLHIRVAHLQTAVAEYRAGTRTVEPVAVPAPEPTDPQEREIAALKQKIADMEHDWQRLNAFFNETARNRDWCSDYEERLYNYNTHFKVLRMVGRPRNWVGSTSNWREVNGG